MRAPVSRSRPLFVMAAGFLVGDHPLVGRLGLLGECTFGVRIARLVDQTPRCGLVLAGAPAVSSSWRSFFLVSEGCWWA